MGARGSFPRRATAILRRACRPLPAPDPAGGSDYGISVRTGLELRRGGSSSRDAPLLHSRAGPLPPPAWQGESFEREVAPGHSAFAVRLTEPAPYWVARLDHPDTSVAGRTWSTEVSVGISPQAGQFGIRVSCVSRAADPDLEVTTPGIVHQVARRPGLLDYAVRLTPDPWW